MRFELLKTILWLRWRLTRNQARKAGRVMQIFFVVLTGLAGLAVFGAGVGGFLLGWGPLTTIPLNALMLVIDAIVLGFLFFWVLGILTEIQRAESIDLQRLLHLPVTLKDVFIVNFIASHFTLGVFLAVPLFVGLTAGLAFARDLRLLILLPLYLCFLFLISAWTYCLRGWLVRLMVNPRRRRTIVIVLTMVVVLGAQAPNLFFNVFHRRGPGRDQDPGAAMQRNWDQLQAALKPAHYLAPPLWVGWGATRAADGNGWPALGAVVICLAGGVAGLSRAYRSTLSFYRGEGKAGPAKEPGPALGEVGAIPRPLEGTLPLVPADVSAATLAFWRSMLRAPEFKMAMLGPVIMLGIFAVIFMGRASDEGMRRFAPLAAIGLTVFSFSGVLQVAFNQFGWDRTGFRALVLLPTTRPRILLAKNLACGAVMLVLGLSVYVALALFMGVRLIEHLAGWLQVVTATIMLCAMGNVLSIVMPVRISAGSLKPTKMPVRVVIVMMLCSILLPVYMIPVLVGPGLGLLADFVGSVPGRWVNLGCSVLVLAVVATAYALTLKPTGRLLWEREQRILDTVTAEIE